MMNKDKYVLPIPTTHNRDYINGGQCCPGTGPAHPDCPELKSERYFEAKKQAGQGYYPNFPPRPSYGRELLLYAALGLISGFVGAILGALIGGAL